MDAADLARRLAAVPYVAWSVCVRDGDGHVLLDVGAGRVLSTASVGKLLLLLEVARRIEDGTLDPARPLSRRADLAVADSGLWQHLRLDALPVADLAVLVASVSDNLATNVLLDHVGLDAVAALGRSLGLRAVALHDRVRDRRTPDLPPRLSSGSAAELSGLMVALARGTCVSSAVSRRVGDWMLTNTDLSMVAAPAGLDPLAHGLPDRGITLRSKTGTDDGVRVDVGVLDGPAGRRCYAVAANWPPEHAMRDPVLAAMQTIGRGLLGPVDRDR